MRNLTNSFLAFTVVAGLGLLVACGGGGSTGPSTPSAPGNPGAPSGGATTPPSSATTPPSGTTTAPATPTPKGATPTPTPSPTPTAFAGSGSINVGYGETNGTTSQLLISQSSNTHSYPGGGNLMPGQPGATSAGGGQGGAVDGVQCQASMPGDYHVHFFLGIFYNGSEVVVPAGLGMVDPYYPSQDINGVPNQSWNATCYYDVHVHDNSGMVHIESLNDSQECGPIANEQPECTYSIFNFQQFLDEWGISVSSTNFGPLTGPVQVYTQLNPPAPYCTEPCSVSASTLGFYTAGALGLGSIPLYSHTVIWIVIGTPPSAGLPTVSFVEGDP